MMLAYQKCSLRTTNMQLVTRVSTERYGGEPSLLANWLELLSLTSRLAVACSGLGILMTDYHSMEEATYHLFPTIPWLMPVTVPLVLMALVALGLQPSNSLKLSFGTIFITLVSIFFILGIYSLLAADDELVLTIKFDRIDEILSGTIFFLQTFMIYINGKRCNNGISASACLFLMVLIATLSALGEKVNCNGFISCMKTLHTWCEPITLALTISSLGLCLPDLFLDAQNYLAETKGLKKFVTVTKHRSNLTVTIGLICASLVYFCSLHSLIMISGSSLLVQSVIEKSRILLNISNNRKSTDNWSDSESTTDNEFEESTETGIDNSDTESSCSDISLIVEEYKAQIKIMNGSIDSEESTLKRMQYVSSSLVLLITVHGLLLAYSIQYNNFKIAIVTFLALQILISIHQWVITRYLMSPENPQSRLKMIYSFLICIVMLGGVTRIVWFYILVWNVKGVILYLIHKHMYNKGVQMKHILSIKETPPVFETTSSICVPKLFKRKESLNSFN